jgi:hypothetical protein
MMIGHIGERTGLRTSAQPNLRNAQKHRLTIEAPRFGNDEKSADVSSVAKAAVTAVIPTQAVVTLEGGIYKGFPTGNDGLDDIVDQNGHKEMIYPWVVDVSNPKQRVILRKESAEDTVKFIDEEIPRLLANVQGVDRPAVKITGKMVREQGNPVVRAVMVVEKIELVPSP